MLVPVQGGVASLQKRNRTIHYQEAAMRTVHLPSVYIFNVSRREFRNRIGAQKSYNIPACEPGENYSEPVVIPSLCLSEIDLADGGNNMGFTTNAALNGVVKIGDNEQKVIGVANDIIGTDSSSPGLGLYTTNLEWFGVFATLNEEPTEEELAEANAKWRQYCDLVYSTGAALVQRGDDVRMEDRPRYNEAAEVLGRKPLWGSLDHTKGSCPECHEDIIQGANFCKHCQQAIDSASVAARAKKRAKEAAEMNEESSEAGGGEEPVIAQSSSSRKARAK